MEVVGVGSPPKANRGAIAMLVFIALALVGAVVGVVVYVRGRRAEPSAPAAPERPKLDAAEAAKVTAVVAESPEDEIFEAEGVEALAVFGGLIGLLDKGTEQGLGTQLISGIVHDIAMSAITTGGAKLGAALAPLTVLEMVYQCSSLGGEDTSGCASSSTFLALQLGMKWKGVPSAMRGWFTTARAQWNIAAPKQTFGALAEFVKATRAMHAAAAQTVQMTAMNAAEGAALRAASKQIVGAAAKQVSGAATKIAASAVAQAGGPVARAAAERGVATAVRVAASGVGSRAAAIGASIGASVAGQFATKAVAMLGGPIGVAVFVAQLALSAVTAHLDASCAGDFAEHCHATRDALVRLTGESSPMRAMFKQELQRRFGPNALGSPDLTLLQPLSFDADRVAATRASMRGAAYRKAFETIVSGGNYEFSSMAEWVERLRQKEPTAQFAEIYEVTHRVAASGEALLDVQVALALCNLEKEAGYEYDARVSVAPCRAGRDACCKRGAAVASMVRAANARPSACAAIKFAVSAIGDAGAVADVYGAMPGSAGATAATWAAWRSSGAMAPAMAFARTLSRRVSGATKPMAYPSDVMRVACTLGVVDILAERASAKSGAEALAVLRRAYAEALSAVFGEEGELPVDELLLPWPSHKAGDVAWMNTDPMLMGLAVRWIRKGKPGESHVGESHEAACAAGGEGRCLPDFAQYANTHVCPHIHAGKDADDPRVYEAEGLRAAHGVEWGTGVCTQTTKYCEEYGMHPEPVDGTVECPAGEKAQLYGLTALYFAKLGSPPLLPQNLCGAPSQCATKRAYCSRGGACTCSQDVTSKALGALGIGETGAGFLKKTCGALGLYGLA